MLMDDLCELYRIIMISVDWSVCAANYLINYNLARVMIEPFYFVNILLFYDPIL